MKRMVTRIGSTGSDCGFTLTELLVSLTITVFIVGTAYMLLNTVTIDSNMVQARTQAAEENRHAMEVVSTELRQAVELVEGYGVFDPSNYSATDCTFYSDIDRDGAPEKVAYDLQSGKLMKSVYQNLSPYPPYSFASVAASGFPKIVCGSVSNTDLFRFVDGQDPPVGVPADRSRDTAAVVLHIVDNSVVGGDTGRSDITTWVKIRSIHSTID